MEAMAAREVQIAVEMMTKMPQTLVVCESTESQKARRAWLGDDGSSCVLAAPLFGAPRTETAGR
jgi:hypothetical protein